MVLPNTHLLFHCFCGSGIQGWLSRVFRSWALEGCNHLRVQRAKAPLPGPPGGRWLDAGPRGLLDWSPSSSLVVSQPSLVPGHVGFSMWQLPTWQLASSEQANERVRESASETEASVLSFNLGSDLPWLLLAFCSLEAGHAVRPHTRAGGHMVVTSRRWGSWGPS